MRKKNVKKKRKEQKQTDGRSCIEYFEFDARDIQEYLSRAGRRWRSDEEGEEAWGSEGMDGRVWTCRLYVLLGLRHESVSLSSFWTAEFVRHYFLLVMDRFK